MASIRAIALVLLLAAPARAEFAWQRLSTTNGPGARVSAGLAYRGGTTGPGMIVYGGCKTFNCDFGDAPSNLNDTQWRLEGTNWVSFSLASSGLPPARWAFAMTAATSGNVLIQGGWGNAQPFWLYDTFELQATRWSSVATTGPAARAMHSMATDTDTGNIVLFGGSVNNSPSDEVWIWDGTLWDQATTTGSEKPAGRYLHAMAYDAFRREFLVYGGANLAAEDLVWTLKCNYTNVSCAWAKHPMNASLRPFAVEGAALAYVPPYENVVLFGGRGNPGTGVAYSGELWRWSGTDFVKVTNFQTLPSGRWRHAMAWDPALRRLVLVGGANPSPVVDSWVFQDGNASDGGTTTTDGGSVVVPLDGGSVEVPLDGGSVEVPLDGGNVDPGTTDAGTEERPGGDGEGDQTDEVVYSRYGCTTAPVGAFVFIALFAARRRKARA